MNLMVKYIFLVLQLYAIASSLVLQESSASSNFESASGPEGNKRLEPSSSPNTPTTEPPPDVAAPIISIPDGSPPSTPVIPPTSPVSVPPIPQPEKGPAIESPVSPPTASAQITSPPKDALQNPPPVAQAAPPSMSQAPPPFVLPEPVTPPPTSPALPVPPRNLPLPVELPPSTLPSSPPMPPSTLPSSPPVPPSTLPSSLSVPPSTLPSSPPPMPPSTLPSSPPMPPSTLPSSPPMPPSTLPSPPPMPPSTLPSSPPPITPSTLPSSPPMAPSTLPSSPPPMPPSTLPSSPPVPPSTLPSSPPMTPSTLPSSPPPIPPSTLPSSPPMAPSTLPSSPPPIPPSTLPSSPPMPPSTLPTSPPMPPSTLPSSPPVPPSTLPSSPPIIPVPPTTLPDPMALPPSTLPRNSPPSQPTLTFPPPNLPAPMASPPSTLPKVSPPSPHALTTPPPNLTVPVALPPHASQVNVPPPHPIFAPPPSNVPVALPPSNSPRNLQPIHHNSSMPPPNLPEPHVSPVSTPTRPSPPNRTNAIAPSPPSPVKAPIGHKAPSSFNHAPPPRSSSESPPTKSHPPPSLPPVYPAPAGPKVKPTHHNPPPPAGPESNDPMHHAPTPQSLGSTVPPVENSISPSIPPPTTSPSLQTTMPVLPPKVSPHIPPRIPKPLQALPPPPPNEDCSSLTCMEPLTSTPPGTPCKCVMPMQVELRLGTSLYNFFPLVSDLAFEMASGLFMRSSQVRIMGANEDDQDPEKTDVMINLVPLGEKFDNYTASVTAQRLWLKQVPIKSSRFGDYEVLFVKYPGLPPSPPMPSSANGGNGGPYGHGNNGRDVKPLGVDVSKQRHNNKLSGGVIAIIALSAVVGVILACVAVWVLVVKRRDHEARSGLPTSAVLPYVTKSSGGGGSMTGSGRESASLSFRSTIAYNGSAKTFSSTDIEKATDNFNESGVLGEGGFGRVYSGVLEDGTKVAVKVLKRDDQQGGREFLAEVEMLSRLHHRNLVRLIGICTEERNRCLVYELIPNGSVESHLHGTDKETTPLDWGARLKIALGAARGLAYLHEDSSPRVIHRDFKSSNILLEHDFTPKVSDFGLARSALDEENQHISTRVMGTFGYVAPEYAMTGHLLVKSDVYSYGVVLLELLTGRKPVDMSMPSGQENLVAWARPLLPTHEGLNLLIDPSLSPEVPFDSIAKVAAIASMCVQPEVSHRPFMGEVVQALKLVCNECEETRDLGSRSSSQEDLTSMDVDPRASTNSGLDPGPSRSNYQSYDSPLDVESGFSGRGLDVDSYRISSSSGPLRPQRRLQIWERVKRFSSGSLNDYGDLLKFLSRSR